MPLFDDSTMSNHTLPGNHYGYSATRIEDLNAAEYTLVGIAADVSASVFAYRAEIERAMAEIVRSCRRSPRRDNLLARITTFNGSVHELHGFRPLPACDPDAYLGCLNTAGTTALNDATINMCDAIDGYATTLRDSAFSCNAIVFVITDGMDNASSHNVEQVAQSLSALAGSASLDSLTSVLIGINVEADSLSKYLDKLQKTARFDRYLELSNATESTLANVARFVSGSIVAQSRMLGAGRSAGALRF
jgi:uncharacterized protein YegL